MAISAVVDFLEATGSDDALKAELVKTLGVGDGDVSDAAELDENESAALLGQAGVDACALAAGKGFDFSVNELQAVVGAFQSFRFGEITDEELMSMLDLESVPSPGAQEAVARSYRGVTHTKSAAGAADGQRRLDVVRFVEATANDDALRTELQAILQAGDGDISDFSQLDEGELQALRSARGALVADFAAKHGYTFTIADLYSIIDAFQRMKGGELSDTAFAKFVDASSQTADYLPFIDSIATMTYKGFTYDKVKPAVAQGNSLEVVRFLQKSHDDEGVRGRLQAIIGGDGDVSSPEELDSSEAGNLIGARSAQVVALANSEGYRFTISDLSAVIGAFQLVEKGTLSLASCKRILGIAEAAEDEALGEVSTTAVRIYRGVPIAAA
ncbi:MAG: hypothetical protein GWM88_05395 [Pseudomonadales bacterium]|nr:hypothetical protein [Pseudomonadales bacterium]NIX07470.1 hypothetical protein [Pseudomonadales bacterium]